MCSKNKDIVLHNLNTVITPVMIIDAFLVSTPFSGFPHCHRNDLFSLLFQTRIQSKFTCCIWLLDHFSSI